MIRRNAANAVTLGRLFLALGVIVFISHPVLSMWLFIAAIISDFIDGALARALKTESLYGAKLDPAADQILAFVGIVSLLLVGWVPLWGVLLVAAVSATLATIEYRRRGRAMRTSLLIIIGTVFLLVYELIVESFVSRAYGFHWISIPILGTVTGALIYIYRVRVARWIHDRPISSQEVAPQ
jgi:phosphatidylglycerophosphate synthase